MNGGILGGIGICRKRRWRVDQGTDLLCRIAQETRRGVGGCGRCTERTTGLQLPCCQAAKDHKRDACGHVRWIGDIGGRVVVAKKPQAGRLWPRPRPEYSAKAGRWPDLRWDVQFRRKTPRLRLHRLHADEQTGFGKQRIGKIHRHLLHRAGRVAGFGVGRKLRPRATQ